MPTPTCTECGQAGASKFIGDFTGSGKFYHPQCLLDSILGSEETSFSWNKSSAKGYLAGMIDGEGHVRKDSGHTEVSNNDVAIIMATLSAARFLCIPSKARVCGSKKGYATTFAVSFTGGKETRKKLLELPISSRSKKARLEAFS